MDFMEKARRCREFIDALDEERRKIEVFHRELPLCLHLITQTIESYTKLMVGTDALISNDEPVLKEFLSLKPPNSTVEENGLNDQGHKNRNLDLMNSSHLWTQESDQRRPKQDHLERPITVRAKRSWGSDVQHMDDRNKDPIEAPDAYETAKLSWGSDVQHIDDRNKDSIEAPDSNETLGSSSAEVETSDQVNGNDAGCRKEEKSKPKRKIRRCWSDALHKRFVQTLEHLGGCHAATPKQIRELMKEDGLTNDEVKSHLQKYRLHTRRINSAAQYSNSNNIPAAQFVMVSGIWLPQMQEYAVATTPNTASVQTNENNTSSYDAPVVSLMPLEQVYQATEMLSDRSRHSN